MIPGSEVCPCCGATLAATERERSEVLLAMTGVLVLKALDTVGKWLLRADRSRFRALGDRPQHQAHLLWQPDDATVDKALRGAWEVVPAVLEAHGSPRSLAPALSALLDAYVHDLAITGTPHEQSELRYRLAPLLPSLLSSKGLLFS